MGYEVSAVIVDKNPPRKVDEIHLVSFGVRKGEEIEEFKPQNVKVVLNGLRGKYTGMMAADKKSRRPPSKKPLTFSWIPRSDLKPGFRSHTGKAFSITITIVDQDTKLRWKLSFDNVELSGPKTEVRIFPPDKYQRNDERFDGTFLTFVNDPG